jgi:Flp pilus assembly protein TadG
VIPIFFVLLIGIIEFSLIFNATLATNFATREGALVAAEAGNAVGADCAILMKVEDSISAPTEDNRIQQVVIFKTDTIGTRVVGKQNVYIRGSMPCPIPGNASNTVGFRSTSIGWPETTRCNTLAGCGTVAPLSPLDHIGVELTYNYSWHTPLSGLIGLGGSGFTMVKSNAMRMEPIL